MTIQIKKATKLYKVKKIHIAKNFNKPLCMLNLNNSINIPSQEHLHVKVHEVIINPGVCMFCSKSALNHLFFAKSHSNVAVKWNVGRMLYLWNIKNLKLEADLFQKKN
jgi:hypothetical protein